MKFIDTIARSGRNLRQAKVRTLLTASALAVGGFTLTATLAAANGAKAYTNQLISTNFNPSALIVSKDKDVFGNNGGPSSKPQLYNSSLVSVGREGLVPELTQSDINKLKAVPGVSNILVNYAVSAQFVTRAKQSKYTGSLAVYDPSQRPDMAAGTAPQTLATGTVLLPNDYLPLLHYGSARNAIGQQITIQVQQLTGETEAKNYTISGVTTQPATSISQTASDIFLSTSDAQGLYNFVNQGTITSDKFLTVSANVTDGTNKAKLNSVKAAIEKLGYAAESVQDTEQFVTQIINVLQIIILVFGAITLVASFFGVVNTQYISVLQRTREIGLMKALGMSRRHVSRLFIIEATWIGFLGAFIGAMIAIIGGTLLNPWISKKLNFGSQHLLVFKPSQIVILIVFLMLVTTLAGLLPARKAARLDPIEALRTE